jgi:hypothetical protein
MESGSAEPTVRLCSFSFCVPQGAGASSPAETAESVKRLLPADYEVFVLGKPCADGREDSTDWHMAAVGLSPAPPAAWRAWKRACAERLGVEPNSGPGVFVGVCNEQTHLDGLEKLCEEQNTVAAGDAKSLRARLRELGDPPPKSTLIREDTTAVMARAGTEQIIVKHGLCGQCADATRKRLEQSLSKVTVSYMVRGLHE